MRIDLQAEPNLFQDSVGLVAARIAGLLGRFVLVFPVIHELDHRWTSVRCDLNQVQI
jgi:hypothetical protein